MAEPFFRLAEFVVPSVVALNGTKITYQGLENIPASGGAIIAVNHTSYVDWVGGSLAAKERHRRLRFMIKAEMADVKAVAYVIKHCKLIPVDRQKGAEAFAVAVQALREGELVGLHPEATISRSFELRDFKTGAARLALEARVPIIPLIVWGAHRIWPKDHPKAKFRNKIPITVAAGPAVPPQGTPEQLTVALRQSMNALLYRVQDEYPHPEGEYWVPRRLGGGAPNRDDSQTMRIVELQERAKKGANRVTPPGKPPSGSR
jgi:1-acyl-sn-glycerol-3-phosphate acyltransferase